MKQPILILSSLMTICVAPCARASDLLEEEPIEMPIVEQPVANNVQFSADEYLSDTMDEIVKTRTRLDELLIPNESVQNLWTDDAFISNSASEQVVALKPMKQTGFSLGDQTYYGETVYIINNFLAGNGDNVATADGVYNGAKLNSKYDDCPFDTMSECAIWASKPTISESVAPRSRKLRDNIMCDIESAIEKNPHISANDKVMAPLMDRYRVLMRASQSCCTGGLMYKLQKIDATQKMIYRFLADDANFSGFGSRCLVMSDEQISARDKYPATTATIADVRNGCLCRSMREFRALLAPFKQLYKEYPQFADAPFEYKHYDGLGRVVTDSVNTDVQNVLNQLEMCP